MPKTFADTKSQMLFLVMVCKMRGLSLPEIKKEIEDNIHQQVSKTSIRNWIIDMEKEDERDFNKLRNSNSAYISEIMTIKKHYEYYRKLVMQTLYHPSFKMHVTPRLIYKAIEILALVDDREYLMLKQMPELFAWGAGGISPMQQGPNKGLPPKDDVFGNLDPMKNASLEEYAISIEQIPIPEDLLQIQKDVEHKSLSAHQEEIVKQEQEQEEG